MVKSDDSSLNKQEYARVTKEARRLLRKADALGTFPTPVAEIIKAGRVTVSPENVLEEGFLRTMRRKARSALKRAASKVIGLFDAHARLIFIDWHVLPVKQTFLKLHETGHATLPWQRDLYAVIEDSEQELDPGTAALFDREANVFATEVLFQLDGFIREADERPFGIKTPLDLSKRYGASVYASVRRYVSKNSRDCTVLVLNPPELVEGVGFRASLRRAVSSPSFRKKFGDLDWPAYFTPDDEIGAMVPIGRRRMSGSREIALVDRNGTCHDCLAEAFTNTYQVFILVHAIRLLNKSTVPVKAQLAKLGTYRSNSNIRSDESWEPR